MESGENAQEQFANAHAHSGSYSERIAANAALFRSLRKVSPKDRFDAFGSATGNLFAKRFAGKTLFIFGASPTELTFFAPIVSNLHYVAVPPLDPAVASSVATQCSYDDSGNLSPELQDRFDNVFSFHVIEHIAEHDLPQHLMTAYGLLRPKGTYWIICPSAVNIYRSPASHQVSHVGRYTYNSLAKEGRRVGFRASRSVLNPHLLNLYCPYSSYVMEKTLCWLPTPALAALGLNSLYVALRKA
jgi:hypothetical protein